LSAFSSSPFHIDLLLAAAKRWALIALDLAMVWFVACCFCGNVTRKEEVSWHDLSLLFSSQSLF
jgi:hypothetical protein